MLGGDDSATEATARLDELRQRRDLLSRALSAAEENERTSREALNSREWQARKNALAQHAGRFQRDAHDVSAALATLNDAMHRMTASGAAITALLPQHMRTVAEPWDSFLGANELLRMTLVEGYRQGRDAGSLLFPRPGAARAVERDDGSLPTLSERIAELTASVRARFDQTAPSVPADKPAAERADKPPPEPVETVRADKPLAPLPGVASPASSAPVIVDVPPSAPTVAGSDSHAPQFSGVQVDLRSNAGERFTDLREPFVWPVGEPVTEADPTPSAASREQE